MSHANGHRWSKFWWQDWANDPALRKCSLAARGLWMAMLCIMHEAEPRGHLLVDGEPPTGKDLAAIVGAPLKEIGKLIEELKAARVYSRNTQGIVFSRRMVRDTQASEMGRETGKRGGNPNLLNGAVPKEDRKPRLRRIDHPRRVERIYEKSEGYCHWCQRPIEWEAFHVDHVIATRDGGTNEEANLVAACPDCNGKRAIGLTPKRHDPLTPSTTPPATGRVNLEAESEQEAEEKQEREERKEVLKNLLFSGTAARAERRPDALEAVLSEVGVTAPEQKPVGAEVVQMAVRRTKKALEMRIPYGETRSVEAQLDALKAQPAVVGSDASMGLRWRPAEPIRTPAEQYAAIMGCPLAEAEARLGATADA